MAEHDSTISKEVKESLERIEKVGNTLVNLAQIEQMAGGEAKTVTLAIDTLFALGCEIGGNVTTLQEIIDPEPTTKGHPEPPAPKSNVRATLDFNQLDAIDSKLRDVKTMIPTLVAAGGGTVDFDVESYSIMLEEKVWATL